MAKKNDSNYMSEIMKQLKDVPSDIKQAFYEEGRQESVKKAPVHRKLGYHLKKNNLVVALIMIGGIFIGVLWVWSNIFQPLMMKFGIIEQRVYNGYVRVPKSFEIFKGNKPTRDTTTKVEVKKGVDSEGKEVKMTMFVDKKGDIFTKSKYLDDIKVVSMRSNFDWRFQPGLGMIAAPLADEEDEMVDPALFLSPLEVYNKVSLDIFASPHRFGGGVSGKLPFKWTDNTYFGGGVGVPYDDISKKEVVFWLRINF